MTTPPPEFARPASSELFAPSKHPEWMNRLCIIRPNYVEYVTFDPAQGPKEVVNAFVVFVDLPNQATGTPVTVDGAQIGGAGLVPQIKGKLGQFVLGRLVQGPQQGQKSGVFKLDSAYTDADAVLAGQYIQAFPLPPQTEAPPTPPPAPQPAASPWAPQAQAPAAAPQWGAQPVPQGPPADVWAGTNAVPAGPPAGQWATAQPGHTPAAAPPPAQAQPPQAWQQQAQAPAPQPAAAPPAWQTQAPAAAPQASAWGAPAPQQQFPAPAAQDPGLVAQVQALGIAIDPTWGNDTLQTIINSPRA